MTLDDIKACLHDLEALGTGPALAGFRMHPKTYAALEDHIRDRADALPAFHVSLTLDSWMPVGLVLPVDREGKPLPKPAEPVQGQVPETDSERADSGEKT